MTSPTNFLLKGTLWTVGAYTFSQILRLVSNVVLARLLSPDVFGIMLIVVSVRVGIDLISDVGVGQNLVYHQNANDPKFYNTAWTLQAIRSVILWLIALTVTWPVARLYQYPILVYIMPFVTFDIVLSGFTSISLSLLRKRLLIARFNSFDAIVSFASSGALILLAILTPTIWAIVFGLLFGSTVRMIGSYFVLPDVKQRLDWSRPAALEIFHFGKWIFAYSLVWFLSSNFDRLYLAKIVPLSLLGAYGIARSISDQVGMLIMHLGSTVLFPFIASHSKLARSELREHLARHRARLLLLAAFGVSFFIATADLVIKNLYDDRYQAVSWMLSLLIVGSWFAILANLNESALLGLGRPGYSAISNGVKFIILLIGMPLSVKVFGLFGGIAVVGLAEICRYVPILIGQRRENFSFVKQDCLVTLLMFLLIGLWVSLRWILGVGISFGSFPQLAHE
jgi:O-antigen/teichoic acid export membrane protein